MKSQLSQLWVGKIEVYYGIYILVQFQDIEMMERRKKAFGKIGSLTKQRLLAPRHRNLQDSEPRVLVKFTAFEGEEGGV